MLHGIQVLTPFTLFDCHLSSKAASVLPSSYSLLTRCTVHLVLIRLYPKSLSKLISIPPGWFPISGPPHMLMILRASFLQASEFALSYSSSFWGFLLHFLLFHLRLLQFWMPNLDVSFPLFRIFMLANKLLLLLSKSFILLPTLNRLVIKTIPYVNSCNMPSPGSTSPR